MKSLTLSDRIISTNLPSFIMGIVNATPDSFYSNSRGGIDKALKLIEDGADILDIGGESTRPGSVYVDEEEELKRVLPIVKEIRKHSNIPISIDTRKSSVMKACLDCGADIINDISALEDDSLMVDLAAEFDCPIILMHKRGIPSTMQSDTKYNSIFNDVNSYLMDRASFAIDHGVKKSKIILDPGIGFGKDTKGNYELIKRINELGDNQFPVLMALSRKRCIGEVIGKDTQDRLFGTLSANIYSIIKGASIVRVHDVQETLDAIKVLKAILD